MFRPGLRRDMKSPDIVIGHFGDPDANWTFSSSPLPSDFMRRKVGGRKMFN